MKRKQPSVMPEEISEIMGRRVGEKGDVKAPMKKGGRYHFYL